MLPGSIRGEHQPRAGDRHLERASLLSVLAAMRAHPASRVSYDHKRAQGNSAALICPARRRCDVRHATLNHRQSYQPRLPAAALHRTDGHAHR